MKDIPFEAKAGVLASLFLFTLIWLGIGALTRSLDTTDVLILLSMWVDCLLGFREGWKERDLRETKA
jgi:hypothetical protein